MPVLDTSFLIRLQARDQKAMALLEELAGETLTVPPWVVVEFLTGHTAKPERVLEDLARAFTLVQTSPEWTMEAAKFRKALHAKGSKIRLPDFWIATFARLLETSVVTQDVKHFAALGVKTRTW
jgi:predicted nucleic acid-binding protein